jgi:transcriptional regulator with GAF, ATPase, and Fis domain
MDKNEFFRQATLCICGNLLLEESLQAFVQLLRQVMPVDRVYLQFYDAGFSAMRTIATATPTKCEKLDQLTPLSEEAKASANRQNLPAAEDVFIFEDPEKYAISREMLKFHNVECTSLMVMLLNSETKVLGSLVVSTQGTEKYTEKDSRLLSMLKQPFSVAMSNTLKHREVLELKDLLVDNNQYLHSELRRISGDEIVGMHFGLKEVMEKVYHVAPLGSPVLLLGETGTGKDVIANAIHYSSPRKNSPFIKVNCGAIPENLIDSALFGHEKGAFTGAVSQKRGFFERAEKGTIFLDEIGELPFHAQVRLLRVLQDKKIERVGGTKTLHLDVRVIAATNRDLEEMVNTGQFRKDLWFRVNVFPIQISPVRQRKTDIPALVQYFITQKSKELKLSAIPQILPGAIDHLMEYDWPGNVRELQNVIERELILRPNGPLAFDHLSPVHQNAIISESKQLDTIERLDDVISLHIRKALTKSEGKIHGSGGAADLLGINPNTLRSRMKKLGISYRKKERA